MSCVTFCGCDGTIRNTGVPNRQLKIEDGTAIIVVPLVADDGTENKIVRSDTLNQAYFQAKVNDPDPSKRWYPIGTFVNVTNTRAESSFETYSDNSRGRTTKGLRTYTGWLLGYSPAYAAVIESLRCVKIGIYLIDDCGQPTGIFCPGATPSADALLPITVNESSIDSLVILQSDAEAGKVQMQFDFSQIVKDQDLRILLSSEMGSANLLRLTKLISTKTDDAESITTTGFEIYIQVDYDSWTAVPVEGLVLGDFRLYNETTAAVITVTSVTETQAGSYVFVIPAQTSGDILTLTQSATTSKPFGISETITIP